APLQGLAVTLVVGLLASMITAVFLTRTCFLVWIRLRPNMRRLKHFNFRLFANAHFDFIKVRRWASGVTAALIVPGMIMLAALGITYSIEFTGGALMHVRTDAPVETTRLRSALERGGVNNLEIQTFGSAHEYVIRARLAGTAVSD